MLFITSNVSDTLLMVLLDFRSTTLPLMILEVELSSTLARSTLFIEANVITVIELFPASDTGMSISTEELKSAAKVSVNVVLFKRIEGVSMLKESLVRCAVIVSRDSNKVELTLLLLGLLILVNEMFRLPLVFRKFHDSFAPSVVRTPAVNRTF